MLMRGKLEIIFPHVWEKLQIKFPVITKETEAIMVLSKYGDRDSMESGRYH